jgi:hypothetical protein
LQLVLQLSSGVAHYFRRYKSRDGSATYTATVRIAGFAPAAKTFPTKREAAEWASTTGELLREHKKRGASVRRDVAVLTVLTARISRRPRDDETAHVRRAAPPVRLVREHGALKAPHLNVLRRLREAREKPSRDRGPATTNRHLSALRSAWNWARLQGWCRAIDAGLNACYSASPGGSVFE